MELNDILKSLRKEHKYSQKQIADLLGVSAKAYSKWEQGVTEPSVSIIKKLYEIYDVSVYELLGINDYM